MKLPVNNTCPCGSLQKYKKCCKVFHDKIKLPKTALELMKSRFCAFAAENADYIIFTTHENNSDFTSDIITILIGINDIGLIMNTDRTPFQQRNMLFSFYKCYADLITILAKSNSRIILMEPFLFPWPACYRTWLPFRQKISQMIHQLSEQFQIPYLTLHEELNEKARRYGYSEITTDGIHLTEQGQKFLADRLYKLICGYSPY